MIEIALHDHRAFPAAAGFDNRLADLSLGYVGGSEIHTYREAAGVVDIVLRRDGRIDMQQRGVALRTVAQPLQHDAGVSSGAQLGHRAGKHVAVMPMQQPASIREPVIFVRNQDDPGHMSSNTFTFV